MDGRPPIVTIHGQPFDTSRLRAISPVPQNLEESSFLANNDVFEQLVPGSAKATSYRSAQSDIPNLPSHLINIEKSIEDDPLPPKDSPLIEIEHDPEHEPEPVNVRYIPRPTTIIHDSTFNIINFTVPDYYTMSTEERIAHAGVLNNRFTRLARIYTKMNIPVMTDNLSPDYLRQMYIRYMTLIEQTNSDTSLDQYRYLVVVYLILLEMIVTRIFKINYPGLASEIYHSKWMLYYDFALNEYCDTGGPSITEGWHPFLKILFYGVCQTGALVVIRFICDKVGSGFPIENLIKYTINSFGKPGVEEKEQSSGIPDIQDPNGIGSLFTQFVGAMNKTGFTQPSQPAETEEKSGPKFKR